MTDNERKELLSKAKPILFNTDMVRAILDGRKTVTRRIVKNNPEECTSKVVNGVCKICDDKGGFYLPDDYVKVRSPYQAGDILYVRETWSPVSVKPKRYLYKTHCPEADDLPVKWHPSIHMPKEAARIFLRVTDVRVERLQDIDGYSVLAEGVDNGKSNPTMGARWENMQLMAFSELWDRTIKKSNLDRYGWAANPWVWVIELERID